MNSNYIYSLFFVVVIACAALVNGVEIFSNFGPGDSFDDSSGHFITGDQAGPGPAFAGGKAMPFQANVDAELFSVELAIGHVAGTNDYRVELRDDNEGAPGEVLESFEFRNLPLLVDRGPPALGTSTARPFLEAQDQYWIAVFPGSPSTFGGWNWTSPLEAGTWAASTDGIHWEFNPLGRDEISAFRVNGTLVPEPSAGLVFMLGGMLMLGLLRLKTSRCDETFAQEIRSVS